LLGATAVFAGETLDQIRETGTLRLGYATNLRPFSFREGAGKPDGYAVELCEKIAAAAQQQLGISGLQTEFVAVDFPRRWDALSGGSIDLLCTAGSPTLRERERFDFSIPIFRGGIGALMRKDAPERMRAILAGEPQPQRPVWRATLGQILLRRVFAVPAGGAAEEWLKGRIDEFNIIATIDPVVDIAQGVEVVASRRADVLFGERSILLDSMARSAAKGDLVVLERQFTYEPYAMAMKRGSDDLRLLVDRTLSRIYRSGEIDQIYARFLGDPDEQTQIFFQHSAVPE